MYFDSPWSMNDYYDYDLYMAHKYGPHWDDGDDDDDDEPEPDPRRGR